ncbi:hypothetical protein [Cellulomonas gilvus]|uniref:Nucleoside 2-deoxyribosyltransferase n=1 Tax=Cellulomonas gilvus (strain ATCC 13127 / NRRL B-14078) TaxID=593907 RepID=F8A2H8_CELGA|nr:hypothetical protein [Cellulomonas gilvus]AEI11835.1 hypothetical protein Celgi_1316 [Cellulomonas gilvus ATCC 13127]
MAELIATRRPRRVYVASSWRNPDQPAVVAALRARGFEVYDFRNPPGRSGFAWSSIDPQWESWTAEQYIAALDHPLAVAGFASDFDAMRWADTFVLVLPCGRSAHLELGWAVGAGKHTVVITRDGEQPELMAKMADHIAVSLDDALEHLSGLTVAPAPVPAARAQSAYGSECDAEGLRANRDYWRGVATARTADLRDARRAARAGQPDPGDLTRPDAPAPAPADEGREALADLAARARAFASCHDRLGDGPIMDEWAAHAGCPAGRFTTDDLRALADLAARSPQPAPTVSAEQESIIRACDWSDYRKEYGATAEQHVAFTAGWDAAMGRLDIGGVQR